MNILKASKFMVISAALFIFPGIKIQAQQNNGINFEQKLSWNQIKDKARISGKYIFVDVFATWCGPCKQMEREVYSLAEVGTNMNDKFISVKVQTDTSKKDNADVRAWYSDARTILVDYVIIGYPSFLFFSPDGRLVHRGLGYKGKEEFKNLVDEALDPHRQNVSLMEEYKRGKKDFKVLPKLVQMAEELKQPVLAQEIIKIYYENYLSKLPDDSLFTKENLSFVGMHVGLLNNEQRLFQLILKRSSDANKLMESGDYSQQVISLVVNRDEIYQKLWKPDVEFIACTPNPDWKKMDSSITAKYGKDYASTLIPRAQLLFYQQLENWNEYAYYTEKLIEKNQPTRNGDEFLKSIGNPPGGNYDSWGLNNISWNIFLNCTNPVVLKKALIWSDLSIKLAWCDLSFKQLSDSRFSNLHQYFDTKANLLYKLGRIKEAIDCEKKAIDIMLKGTEKGSDIEKMYAKSYRQVIEKMKKAQPTWPVKKSTKIL